jgi:adenine-specific DNA methylase
VTHVISIVGKLAPSQTGPAQNQIEKKRKDIQTPITVAIKVMEEALASPNAELAASDKISESWLKLVDLMRQVKGLHEKQAKKLIQEQFHGISLVSSTEKMGTRYTGSKTDQVDISIFHLAQCVPLDAIKRAADVFAGRANMAYAMKQRGWETFANDKLAWSYEWARWCIEAESPPLTMDEVRGLFNKGKTLPKYDFVSEFAKPYRGPLRKMTPENAERAKIFLSNSEIMPDDKRRAARALLAASIFDLIPFSREDHGVPSGVIYNLEVKTIQKYSQYAKYPKKSSAKGYASHKDAVEFLEGLPPLDLLYFDPPYSQHGKNFYDSTIPESIIQGRLVSVEELNTDFISKDRDIIRNVFKRLCEAADKKADIWMLAWHDMADFEWWRVARILNDYRSVSVLSIPHANQPSITDDGAKQTLGELLFVCVPFPTWLQDKRIMTGVRRSDISEYDGKVWSGPGKYVDDEDPRMDAPAIDVNPDGTVKLHFHLLDKFPNDEEILERETAKLMPLIEAQYKLLLGKAEGEKAKKASPKRRSQKPQ